MSFSKKIVVVFWICLALGRMAAPAETIFWKDHFETAAGDRWTTNAVWQIGIPSSGPPVNTNGSHSYTGSYCAMTGIKGNAAYNADSEFICTNYQGPAYLTVPDASQHPRLRFWQWFNFVNSEGFVEIQVAGTTNWQTISQTNLSQGGIASYSSGVWSRPSIDLSAYAGENVRFAFRFISGGNYGSDPGWYIDDVQVVTGEPVFNNPEGFEAGLGDWAVDSGTWEVGVPTSGPPTNSNGFRAHSGTNCAATVLAGNYGWNVYTRLISPPFTVPTSGNQALRFWQWYKFINAAGYVEVSSSLVITNINATTNYITATNVTVFTNISTFTNIVSFTNVIITTQTNITTVTNVNSTTNIFNVATNISFTTTISSNSWQTISPTNVSAGSPPVSSNGQWTNTTLDLSPFSGQTIQVAFHFLSGGGGYGNAPGWYIDDISLVQNPTLTMPAAITITNGQTFTVTASATNSTVPGAKYTFALLSPSTNAFITAKGVLNWTNTRPALGTTVLTVQVSDDSQPPLLATNSLAVNVLPAYIFSASNTLLAKNYFLLSLQSLSNTTWVIDASTDLVTWQPVFTNQVTVGGFLLFTDTLATNFPYRFYQAVFP